MVRLIGSASVKLQEAIGQVPTPPSVAWGGDVLESFLLPTAQRSLPLEVQKSMHHHRRRLMFTTVLYPALC